MILPKDAPPIDILIIDSYYMLYRAHCSTPPLKTPGGFPTGAMHGFMGGLLNLIKELKPARVVLALEGGGDSDRASMDPNYKVQRSSFPDELSQQMPHLWKICQNAGIQTISISGTEADDVIASICVQNPTLTKAIFTTDKDIISLTNENTFIVKKEKGKVTLLDATDIKAKWGVEPSQIPEVLKLAGDSIDNVPGIPGIGLKTATTLIQTWGTCENIYANLDKLSEKHRNLFTEHKASYELSRQLINLVTALSVDLIPPPRNIPVLEVMLDTFSMTKVKGTWVAWLNANIK
jgi:DNA polymerase I